MQTILDRSAPVRGAAAHLLDSAGYRTKSDGDPLDVLARKFGDHATEVMTKLGASNETLAALKEQVANLEQRALEDGRSTRAALPSIGKQFVENDRVKSFLSEGHGRGRIDMKFKASLTTATTDAAGSVGALGTPAYRDNAVTIPQRRPRVRSLIPTIRISSGAAEWPSQKGRTINAAMVAEGTTKPQSDLQFEMKSVSAKVIAHYMKASRQVLDDAPQLRGLIDTELLDGLALKEEAQLLNGDGTGQNLYGLIPQATGYAAPVVLADVNILDVVALAMLQVSNAYFEPDGTIINLSDWLVMRTTKNSQGDYILGTPNISVPPTLWGAPLVATPAMASRKFLTGQFAAAATIYDRWDARVEVATENEDDFIKNMLTILAEERLALGVKQPGALVYGDFDAALAA